MEGRGYRPKATREGEGRAMTNEGTKWWLISEGGMGMKGSVGVVCARTRIVMKYFKYAEKVEKRTGCKSRPPDWKSVGYYQGNVRVRNSPGGRLRLVTMPKTDWLHRTSSVRR